MNPIFWIHMRAYWNAHWFELFWNYLPNTGASGIDQWFTATLGQHAWIWTIPESSGCRLHVPWVLVTQPFVECTFQSGETARCEEIPVIFSRTEFLSQTWSYTYTIRAAASVGSSQGHCNCPRTPEIFPLLGCLSLMPWCQPSGVRPYPQSVPVCGGMIPITDYWLLLAWEETGSWGEKVRVWGTRSSRFFCL